MQMQNHHVNAATRRANHDQQGRYQATVPQYNQQSMQSRVQMQNQMNARQQQSFHTQQHQAQQNQERGYKFGDLTKSVIAKGKQADGRNNDDGYKFGIPSILSFATEFNLIATDFQNIKMSE